MGSWSSGNVRLKFILLQLKQKCVNSPNSCMFRQSRAHPREIITEVLKALQELNVCWKKIGHYNMKCRWNPGFVENMMHNNHGFGAESAIIETDDLSERSAHIVKFEIQVPSWSLVLIHSCSLQLYNVLFLCVKLVL